MIKCSKALGEIIERRKRYFTPSEMETVNVSHGKLILLEEMEEQGRLVILPCKVGDAVFSVFEDECVFCGEVYAISMCGGTNWFSVRYDTGLRYDHKWDDFGRTIFLFREEAEAVLEGEKEDV